MTRRKQQQQQKPKRRYHTTLQKIRSLQRATTKINRTRYLFLYSLDVVFHVFAQTRLATDVYKFWFTGPVFLL